MTSEDTCARLKKIVRRFFDDWQAVEHLTIKVHRDLGGAFIVEEEWDWKG